MDVAYSDILPQGVLTLGLAQLAAKKRNKACIHTLFSPADHIGLHRPGTLLPSQMQLVLPAQKSSNEATGGTHTCSVQGDKCMLSAERHGA
jgi:hypothetical protein